MLIALFWLSVGILVWVYVGYPAFAYLVGEFRPRPIKPIGSRPTLTVAIAVHNEAERIEARIVNALDQAGPDLDVLEVLVGSDGSTDRTEAIVRGLALTDKRVRLLALPRAGQTAAQNHIFDAAIGDVVVLTDAETNFEPGCLAALAETLRDPQIGCATGRLEWRNEDSTVTAANEGLYWRYERLVRSLESRAGLLTAVTGALLAVRRSAFRPVPASASMDHLLPLYVCEAGGRVAYVNDAVATDRPISGLREQVRNRTRTATRGIRSNLSMVVRLAPWNHPASAVAIWSHKLLRWATPWLITTATLTGALLALSTPAYALIPLAVGAGLVAAIVGHLAAGRGHRPPRLMSFARSFAAVNVAFAAAWVNVIRGRRIETWRPAKQRYPG